jgi:lysophospholipase L1-like esterase
MVQGQPFSRHGWIGELTLRGIREILSELVAQRSATDPNIHYMDGLQLFNETEALTMPDGIHPDAAGYRKIAANFVERVPREWLAG